MGKGKRKGIHAADKLRKQQRKKEKLKNKKIRQAFRERRAGPKEPEQLLAQIREIEKQGKKASKTQRQKKKKLQEEYDELIEKRKAQEAANPAPKQKSAKKLEKEKKAQFPTPEASPYYHPTLNPYGAPPPGAPSIPRASSWMAPTPPQHSMHHHHHPHYRGMYGAVASPPVIPDIRAFLPKPLEGIPPPPPRVKRPIPPPPPPRNHPIPTGPSIAASPSPLAPPGSTPSFDAPPSSSLGNNAPNAATLSAAPGGTDAEAPLPPPPPPGLAMVHAPAELTRMIPSSVRRPKAPTVTTDTPTAPSNPGKRPLTVSEYTQDVARQASKKAKKDSGDEERDDDGAGDGEAYNAFLKDMESLGAV